MTTPARTVLARAAALTLRRSAVTGALAVAVLSAPLAQSTGSHEAAAPRSPADVLVSRYHCWTGPAPQGAVPAHAVVTSAAGRTARVPAAVGYGIWLDGDPGTLHAFCP